MCDTNKIKEFVEVEWKISILDDSVNVKFQRFASPPFYFAETSWRMVLVGQFIHSASKFYTLFLLRKDYWTKPQYALHYTLSLAKMDKSVEMIEKGIMNDFHLQVKHSPVNLTEVLSQDSNPSIFSITCTLSIKDITATKSKEAIRLTKFDTLSENFRDLYTDKMNYDTTIYVKGMEYRVHRVVLIARAKIFAAMFQHDTSEKKTGIIKILDCDPDSFQYFLEFLYCGTLDEVTPSNAHYLFETAEKYGVLELKAFCKAYLLENLTLENWYDVKVIAEVYQETALLSAVQKFFSQNTNSIFQTSIWEQLMQENPVLANELLNGLPNVAFAE